MSEEKREERERDETKSQPLISTSHSPLAHRCLVLFWWCAYASNIISKSRHQQHTYTTHGERQKPRERKEQQQFIHIRDRRRGISFFSLSLLALTRSFVWYKNDWQPNAKHPQPCTKLSYFCAFLPVRYISRVLAILLSLSLHLSHPLSLSLSRAIKNQHLTYILHIHTLTLTLLLAVSLSSSSSYMPVLV